MKRLTYEVTKDKKELKVSEYKGKPYLLYKENECGIYLETALKDEEINELRNNIEFLHLPDDVLLALGISVSEDETLEELCERLRKEDIECEFRSYEDEECGYTEEIMISLEGKKKVKMVIIEDEKSGKKKVKIEKTHKPFLQFTYSPPRKILEVVISIDKIKNFENLNMKEILKNVLGDEIEPEDVVDVLELIDEKYDTYTFQVERDKERVKWRLNLS